MSETPYTGPEPTCGACQDCGPTDRYGIASCRRFGITTSPHLRYCNGSPDMTPHAAEEPGPRALAWSEW